MKCYIVIVLVLVFEGANATFWYKNDDLEQVMGSYKSNLSQDYLRALSIFKRKLQLLGFYPIVLNDDGLEYVSMDPYLIEDDYDDQMYKLLKQIKKEKKSRKKLLKKKLKKSKKNSDSTPPVSITTAQPISNIVYYWPSTITTIVHPGQGEGTASYQQSFGTTADFNESSEENSSEADSSSDGQKNKNEKQKPPKKNYDTNFSFERKSTFDDDDTETRKFTFDDDDTEARAIENRKSISLTTSTSITTPSISATTPSTSITTTSTSTTTPTISTTTTPISTTPTPISTTTTPISTNPLITLFPNPDEVAIQEILDQQEIVNKISFSDENEGNITETFSVENQFEPLSVQYNSSVTDTLLNETMKVPVYEATLSISEDTLNKEYTPEGRVLSESTKTDITLTGVTEPPASESSVHIPTGVLQFFHETLPDEEFLPISSPSPSEVVDNTPISTSTVTHISHEITETSENNKDIDEHRETDPQPNHSIVQINEGNTTTSATVQPLTTSTTPDDRIDKELEATIHPENLNTNESEGLIYSFDPKISLPIEIVDNFESRSLTDKPAFIAAIADDKSGRRSDVPIEADDITDEDTTDNLAYNLTGENLLEQSNVLENTSAETSTPPPTPSQSADALNYDEIDQFDGEIIPLIPIIIKQMKQGNVSPEEMEILQNTFGPFWPFIVEEATRESDSSEEMNPLLSEVLNSINRKIVKREATVGRWTQPIYGRRIYFDDDDVDFAPRRRYYGRRRRPIVAYY